MKIRIKEITLNFFPNYSSKCDTNCDVELTINICNKLDVLNWKASNVSFRTAKKIYECSKNKSLCLINVRNRTKAIEDFCKFKVDTFEDVEPETNFKQYEVWVDLKRKEKQLQKKIENAEKVVWKKSGKEKPVVPNDGDYEYIMKQINKWEPNVSQPYTITYPQSTITYPSQPVWIDHGGGNYSYSNTVSGCSVV
jgi:hypothetical protein